MCKFIGMEYLAAAVFIHIDEEEISLQNLSKYNIEIMKTFEEEKISAVILYSNRYAQQLVRNFSDCFELNEDDTVLRRKVSKDELITKFLDYLSTDLLIAFSKNKFRK